jgi:cytochrome P450
MGEYFRGLIAARRAEPRDDPLSLLIRSEIDGRRLNDDELVGSMMMVLNGGHETTANLLNNSMLALAEHPAAAEHLRRHPSKTVTAVEEFLRYDSDLDRAKVFAEHWALVESRLRAET